MLGFVIAVYLSCSYFLCLFFFFFKQKTAYEIRISDWSSDVCSSDLLYPGASPDVMTSLVTSPLERQFGQMPGLNQMSSTSSGGASVITMQFSLDVSLDVAEQEVQAAINAASNLLPDDLPVPPVYNKVNPADRKSTRLNSSH